MANNQMKRSFSHMEMQTIPARGPEGEGKESRKGEKEGRRKEKGVLGKMWRN